MPGVKDIQSKAQFEVALAEAVGQLVVVDFYADWCGPCKVISPYVAELSEQYTDVVFLKVNVDETAEVAEDAEITAMPTFGFYKNGKEVDRLVGASQEKLKEKITNLK